MSFSNIELPSNRKFGLFFSLVFFIAASYSHYVHGSNWSYTLASICIIFFVITVIKANVLLPLNKLWMQFGLLLGMVVSPVVLGVIFFGIFTPVALGMRLFGRDELRLKFKRKSSHWVSRTEALQPDSFKNQF